MSRETRGQASALRRQHRTAAVARNLHRAQALASVVGDLALQADERRVRARPVPDDCTQIRVAEGERQGVRAADRRRLTSDASRLAEQLDAAGYAALSQVVRSITAEPRRWP